MTSRLLATIICLCLSPLLVAEQVRSEALTTSIAQEPVVTGTKSSIIETHDGSQTTTQVATPSSAVPAQAHQIETTDPYVSNPTPQPKQHRKADHSPASIGRTIASVLLLPLELPLYLLLGLVLTIACKDDC